MYLLLLVKSGKNIYMNLYYKRRIIFIITNDQTFLVKFSCCITIKKILLKNYFNEFPIFKAFDKTKINQLLKNLNDSETN